MTSEASIPAGKAVSLARHPPLLFYLLARSCSEFAYQIATVAIGWQIYALTGSAFDLGLAGLVQFLPSALLVFAAGHAADRYDRRRLAQICDVVQGLAAFYLATRSLAGIPYVAEIFVVLALLGIAAAFKNPAASALLPAVVPEGSCSGRLRWSPLPGRLPRSAALRSAVLSTRSRRPRPSSS